VKIAKITAKSRHSQHSMKIRDFRDYLLSLTIIACTFNILTFTVRSMALLPIMEAKESTASLDQTPALSGLLPAGTISTSEHSIDISGSRRKRG